jgi:DNA-dependent RNA polymerase auxiliary subunit epsilon
MRGLGEQGWEVASARRATSGEGSSTTGLYEVIFKRPTSISEGEIAAREKSEALYMKQMAGRATVKSLLLGEQAHYLENSRFTESVNDLELNLEPETEDYKFNITLEDAAKVVVTGAAKNGGLNSYTGAVYYTQATGTEESTALSILCATDKPSRSAPKSPQIANGVATCPAGSSEVKSE